MNLGLMLKVNFGDSTVCHHTVLPTFLEIFWPPPPFGGRGLGSLVSVIKKLSIVLTQTNLACL
jgi:hypothetical protein